METGIYSERSGYMTTDAQAEYREALVGFIRTGGFTRGEASSILGISQASLSRYINGRRRIPKPVILLIKRIESTPKTGEN